MPAHTDLRKALILKRIAKIHGEMRDVLASLSADQLDAIAALGDRVTEADLAGIIYGTGGPDLVLAEACRVVGCQCGNPAHGG